MTGWVLAGCHAGDEAGSGPAWRQCLYPWRLATSPWRLATPDTPVSQRGDKWVTTWPCYWESSLSFFSLPTDYCVCIQPRKDGCININKYDSKTLVQPTINWVITCVFVLVCLTGGVVSGMAGWLPLSASCLSPATLHTAITLRSVHVVELLALKCAVTKSGQ